MRLRIPQGFIYEFAADLVRELSGPLEQAGIDTRHFIDNELENVVYEAGEREWEEDENSDGTEVFLIDYDPE